MAKSDLGAKSSRPSVNGRTRRQAIADLVQKTERVDVNELSEHFEVTIETVRRDLIALEESGLIGRVHGGAVLRAPGFLRVKAPTASERAKLRIKEKIAIAEAALSYIPDGGVVILDAGTTVLELARRIGIDAALTLITMGLPAALDLSSRGFMCVLIPGGEVNPQTFASEGEWALNNIQELSADVAFVGVSGVSIERGFTTSSHMDALMKQAILSAAKLKVVLADSSKIGTVFTSKICAIDEIDVLVTNSEAESKFVQQLRTIGVEVVIV